MLTLRLRAQAAAGVIGYDVGRASAYGTLGGAQPPRMPPPRDAQSWC